MDKVSQWFKATSDRTSLRRSRMLSLSVPSIANHSTRAQSSNGRLQSLYAEQASAATTITTSGITFDHILELIDSWGGRAALQGKTTVQVCNLHIKPATAKRGLSLCQQYLRHEDTFDLVRESRWFVSHQWNTLFLDTVDAIGDFMARCGLDTTSTHLWIDLFSTSQHGVQPKSLDWFSKEFPNAIKKIGNTVLVLDPLDLSTLKRTWCLYQLSFSSPKSFQIAMSPTNREKFMMSLKEDPIPFHDTLIKTVQSTTSETTDPRDKESIVTSIENSAIGFSELDSFVVRLILGWTKNQMTREIEANVYSDPVEGVEWMISLAAILKRQGLLTQAQDALRESLRVQKLIFGASDGRTVSTAVELADVLQNAGDSEEAEQIYLESWDICMLAVVGKLGWGLDLLEFISAGLVVVYEDLNRISDCEAWLKSIVKTLKAKLGEENATTLRSMNVLGEWYRKQDRNKEAKTVLSECVEGQTRVLGSHHPDTLASINNLALVLLNLGFLQKSAELLSSCLELERQNLGENHASTLTIMENLATVYIKQIRYTDAEQLLMLAINGYSATIGSSHHNTISAINNLALLYIEQDRLAEAEEILLQVLAYNTSQSTTKIPLPQCLVSMTTLSSMYMDQKRFNEAALLLERCLVAERRSRVLPNSESITTMHNLAFCYIAIGKTRESELLLLDCFHAEKARFGVKHPNAISEAKLLVRMYKDEGRAAEAVGFFEREFGDDFTSFSLVMQQ
ncbi:UNVERIFIED_CONTAM: hypothetical protein HDU68_010276 [Siphonaria sp. JEL0065]|nr:hypothetical protein HDU68_010276 [Siphonaria sp. JEL0065]